MQYEISRQVYRAELRAAKKTEDKENKALAKHKSSRELIRRQKNDPNSILSKAMNAVSRISQVI